MRKRKTSALVAALLLLITVLPLFVWLGIMMRMHYVQRHMKEQLEREQLVELRLPASDVVWYKQGKEIVVNGKLFDIKSAVLADGSYTFTGLYDEQEDALHAHLEQAAKKDQPGKASAFLHQFHLFTAVLPCFPTIDVDYSLSPTNHFPAISDRIVFSTLDVQLQPPRML